jgi:hypothetical protein
MNNFVFKNSTELVFGKAVEEQVGAYTAEYGSKVLLHYGGGSIKRTGLYDRIIKSLQKNKVDYVELGGVQANPRLSLVQEGIKLCHEENVDFILAVGGGSVIDSAKTIAVGAKYDGNVWDCFIGKGSITNMLPLGVVLTIPAAGSETSDSAVITNEEGWLKRPIGHPMMRPVFALLNPELTYTLPDYQTACGVSDMLAHTMERYFTNTPNVDLTDRLCEATMRSIIEQGPKVLENPKDYAARAEIMLAGTVAHNNSLDMGRETDWASHDIEHELSGIYDLAHGAGLSIVFPAWMKYVYKVNKPRFEQFAYRVFGIEPQFDGSDASVIKGIKALENFYVSMGLPIRLEDAEIRDDRYEEMAKKATNNDTRTLGHFKPLDSKDIHEIYKLCAMSKKW